MRVSIFGCGYVGTVSAGCLSQLGHQVIAVDIARNKLAMLGAGKSPIVEAEIDHIIAESVAAGKLSTTNDTDEAVRNSDISLISVGTPGNADGTLSLQAVEEVASEIGESLRNKSAPHCVVMRSTVPPGTADQRVIPILEKKSGKQNGVEFRYYSNPEFLREGSSVSDFRAPPFTLIGVPAGDDATALRQLYDTVEAPLFLTSYRTAESVKYLCNAYHAVKLAFANEAGSVLAAHGVDAREAFRLFCEDRVLNISSAYLRPGFAFGGSCLPKDVRGLLALANAGQVSVPMLSQILPSNRAIVERAFQMVVRHGRQPVGLFGLAFKPRTDDLRESPFVTLAEQLLGRGFVLRIVDRFVEVARLTGSNRAYIEREIPHLERLMVGTVQEVLAESRIVIIGHVDEQDREELFARLTDQWVLDLYGIPELQNHPGISYEGLHW